MVLSPMRLLRIPEPFDHPDFLFEPKLDGFRALAHIDRHRCSVISRNGNVFKSWPQLCEELAGRFGAEAPCLMAKSAALIRTAAPTSRACFSGASNRHFYAFDLLMLNGRDLRGLPLTEGKRRLADRHELFEVWESRRPRFHRATLALV